jgi:amino acid transporter
LNEKIHERGAKIINAYIAFILSLLLALTFKNENIEYSNTIISLIALSLPSLIVINFIDYIVRVKQERKNSMFRGLAAGLGFIPSLVAIILFIASFSIIASILFTILIIFWIIILDIVTYLGFKHKNSDI